MADERFDPKAVRTELAGIRRRLREIEQATAAHLRQQLTDILMAAGSVRESERLLADVREVLAEGE
jgi:hypothetical protein